jgi:tRNA pseudouridine13 synthase
MQWCSCSGGASDMAMEELAYAFGGPVLRAAFKQEPADFQVTEVLGFEPDGSGEHLFVEIEKSGLSTFDAQTLLARHFGVAERDTAFAGMKDRQGITRQWFSLRLTGRPDRSDSFSHPRLRILRSVRNSRKLRRGCHRGNQFRILLRNPVGDSDFVQQRLAQVADRGVPNYFGEQRFGRDGDNVAQAQAWFAGGVEPTRQLRSLLLSAARSHLFNACLAARVTAGNWDQCLDGELLALAGSASIFPASRATLEELQLRLQGFDIHPSGPLWGKGQPAATGVVLQLEMSVASAYPELCTGLAAHGLEQERRALRLQVAELESEYTAEGLVLGFVLERGSYATTVLRELLEKEPS